MNPVRIAVAALATLVCLWGAAGADPAGFVGTWANSDEGPGFIGRLTGSGSKEGAIARVVISPAGVSAVRVHLFGRCQPECDWGTQLAHGHSEAPDSDDIRSLTAEFNTGKAIKRLTLHKGPGNTLRFELITDFTEHAGLHDYESNGSLRLVPPAAVPQAVSQLAAPTAVSAAEISEDCEKINPEDVYVAPSDRGWKVSDFNHTILNYGSDKSGAVRASRVLGFYRFDEQCYIGGRKAKMMYWRVAGQFPRDPMPGEDCVALSSTGLRAKSGKVLDGERVVVDFNGNAALAEGALSVLRTYHVSRQCYVARPSDKMVYWLMQ